MLYNALIVDDERAAHEIISRLVDWKKAGYNPPVSAYNGKQALEIYSQQSFNIVLTDIIMPIMDGLELIKRIKEINPQQRIVVISCHEKFEYARRAIQMGVDDYLVKDLVTEHELYSLIVSNNKKNGQTLLKGGSLNLHISDIISQQLSGVQINDEDRKKAISYLQLGEKNAAAAMYIMIEDYCSADKDYNEGTHNLKLIRFMTLIRSENIILVQFENARWLAICNTNTAYSLLNYMSSVAATANSIRASAEACGYGSLSIGISNPFYNFNEIPQAYMEACKASEMRIINGLNKNYFYNSVREGQLIQLKTRVLNSQDKIYEMINSANNNVIMVVSDLYKVDFYDGFKEAHYYKYINLMLANLLEKYINDSEIERDEVCKQKDMFDYADRLENPEEMAQYYCTIINRIINRQFEGKSSEDKLLMQAKQVINEYYKTDISLSFVAEKLHVHKGYLCRVFKMKTGKNIMQYIINKKIENAKHLLENTDTLISEVSSGLGFATPQYFSIVFKKNTGVSPNEYRKLHRKDGN